jgi:glucokinase
MPRGPSRAPRSRRAWAARLLLLNDFAALALSLPHLGPADLRQVGGGRRVALAPKAVLGPGTGLGVSGVLYAIAGTGWR